MLRSLLQLPELKDWPHGLDAPETTVLHGEILQKKPFLKNIYSEWYSFFVKESKNLPQGTKIELGSGSGFIKDFFPEMVTTDVLKLPNIDKVMSAEEMDYSDNSISGIYMIDVLHHIPHPEYFFNEANRCLVKGGKIIMVEPANSFWGRFIYKNFHHEPFHPESGWEIPSTGPMSGANGAIPWILFVRDRKLFEKKFPNLKIKSIKYHTPFRYLICGGVSMKSLVPNWSFGFFTFFDALISTLSFGQISMFQKVVIEKI